MINDLYNSTNAKSLSTYYGFAPEKILKGKGVILFDTNQNEFIDCGMALGSVSLGYAFDEVDEFVIEHAIKKGVNYSRPSYLEEELNDLLQKEIGFPVVARFAKSSSVLLSILPRVCRYLTQKTLIAYPLPGAYLGNADWYLSKNIKSGGILPEIKEKTITFINGDVESLRELFKKHSQDLACIVMEPFRDDIFDKDFYAELSSLCLKNNVLLIFDETVSGFRFGYPLAQHTINCKPDLTIIGKAWANGYAISAIIAERPLMEKIEECCSSGDLFDFSTTHAGESIGLAAAIKTLDIYGKKNVVDYINTNGKMLMSMLNKTIKDYSLDKVLTLKGQPTYFQISSLVVNAGDKLKKGIIEHFYNQGILFRGAMSMSLSHSEKHLDRIAKVFEDYCRELIFDDAQVSQENFELNMKKR